MKTIKVATAVLLTVVLTGCAGFSLNQLPNKFDNVEYRDLVELNVLSKWSETCSPTEIERMDYLGNILKTYSKGTLNDNVAEIYSEVSSLTSELRARENPSQIYCKLKRENITIATEKAIEIFGGRLK